MATIQIGGVSFVPSVESIDETLDINEFGELYLVMNLPNLKRAKFNLDLIYTFNDYIKELYMDYLNEDPHRLEEYSVWITYIYPVLHHYCDGKYMNDDKLFRHRRNLKDTDFSFTWQHLNGEDITIRYAENKVSVCRHLDGKLRSEVSYSEETGICVNRDLDLLGNGIEAKKMYESLELCME